MSTLIYIRSVTLVLVLVLYCTEAHLANTANAWLLIRLTWLMVNVDLLTNQLNGPHNPLAEHSVTS